ncbi:hypothetical protein T265_14857 [Opisthorchis viverrini]|uniref:Dynein axonemal light chain 4 n=1 Tax=Opisthorchis viverrini TaxID=6198 RepID=A0A074ZGT8_OPIVI|nr:hypothetical protein T265_14857 [Opisthorchis viverrini]KER22455.1 hypothetical protein T265_14857 [Opisthorchis viverrini]
MEEEKEVKEDVVKNAFTYPLVRYSEMNEELQAEVVELCVTACEKWHSDNEMAARMIKEALDQKASSGWHVVIGEGYGFEVTHDVRSLLFMYFNGSLAILIWKGIGARASNPSPSMRSSPTNETCLHLQGLVACSTFPFPGRPAQRKLTFKLHCQIIVCYPLACVHLSHDSSRNSVDWHTWPSQRNLCSTISSSIEVLKRKNLVRSKASLAYVCRTIVCRRECCFPCPIQSDVNKEVTNP